MPGCQSYSLIIKKSGLEELLFSAPQMIWKWNRSRPLPL